MKFVCIAACVIACILSRSGAFLSSKFTPWKISGTNPSYEDVSTHEDITRNAILEAITSTFKDNPNPEVDNSVTRVNSLSTLSVRNLITAYYGVMDRGKIRNFESAIAAIANANNQVDLQLQTYLHPEPHFLAEKFEAGQIGLIEMYALVVNQIESSNFEQARKECGRLLHSLQDFYSHSNWVENGNNDILDALGRSNTSLGLLAGPDVETCTDCILESRILQLTFYNSPYSLFQPYRCRNNVRSAYLTSAYGVVNSKPRGKCGHGGFQDRDRHKKATGGISKETPFSWFSTHYYLHDEAARLATKASSEMLQRIRSDIRNDSLFGMFLGISLSEQVTVQKTSIAYVIDTTGSMGEELPEIQASIPQIRVNLEAYARNFDDATEIKYILAPFNDPDPGITIETRDINTFLSEIGKLTAQGGGDTPEPSIGATIRAIEASEPRSPIYVFTDAPPSDGNRSVEAISLISNKQNPITFALVDLAISRKKRSVGDGEQRRYSRIKRQSSTSIYEQLSEFSGGQVLSVTTGDLSELSSLVSTSAVRNRRTIFRSFGSGSNTYTIPIDISTLEASISVSGTQITVSVLSPQGTNAASSERYSVSLNTPTSYISQLQVVNNSQRGNWTITVGSSSGSYSIQVIGISDLSITHNTYKNNRNSTLGFSELDGKPIQGEPLIVIISARIEDTYVNISSWNVVSGSGANIEPVYEITRVAQCCYAGIFVPPTETFIFQVIGLDSSGYSFSHFTDTAIQVSSVILRLDEGEMSRITLRPGEEESNSSIIVQNYGDSTSYGLSATVRVSGSNRSVNADDFVTYSLDQSSLSLERNGTDMVILNVALLETARNDTVVFIFTVIAQSATIADNNNFIEIEVVFIPRPAPILKNIEIATPAPPTTPMDTLATTSSSNVMLNDVVNNTTTMSRTTTTKAAIFLEIFMISAIIMLNKLWNNLELSL